VNAGPRRELLSLACASFDQEREVAARGSISASWWKRFGPTAMAWP